uniref:Uncharacterized protein n=1 Tax=Anguilla anguilla TaxID=7936 RepID=A0A0E9WDQ2_ANGAN
MRSNRPRAFTLTAIIYTVAAKNRPGTTQLGSHFCKGSHFNSGEEREKGRTSLPSNQTGLVWIVFSVYHTYKQITYPFCQV